MVRSLLVTTKDKVVHTAITVHEGLSGSAAADSYAIMTDRLRLVRSLHLCLLSNRFCSDTLCKVQKCAQSFLQQLISAVEELEAVNRHV